MAELLVLLFTAAAIADGFLLTFLVLEQASLFARLCYGSIIGLLLLAWISFLASLLVGLNAIAITITAVILLTGVVLLYRFVPRERLSATFKNISADRWSAVYYLAWTIFLSWIFSRVINISDEGLHTAPANNYGDLPFHLSVITSFAYGENLPPRNPIFDGMRFTYPFLIDFLTAFFVRLGASWSFAFFIENIILAISLVGCLELLTLRLTSNRLAARLAPVIFLFNGGFGFVSFLRDFFNSSEGLFEYLAHLPRTYTMNDQERLRWGNIFTTTLIPQRSLLFGLPLAAMIFSLWWKAIEATGRLGDGGTGREEEGTKGQGDKETRRQGDKETHKHRDTEAQRKQINENDSSPLPLFPSSPLPSSSPRRPVSSSPRRLLLAAGILAGLLPMAHAHGFFSVMLVSALLALTFFSWDWLFFFLPAGLLALPQALFLSGTPTRSKMFEPHLGWEAGEMSLLWFWWLNAGVFLVLLLVALVSKLISSDTRNFYLPFLLCFILPNAVLLAPWAWDNIKVLLYWYLASVPLVAVIVAWLFAHKNFVLKIAGAAGLVTLILSGALDVTRALSKTEYVQLYSRDDLAAAEKIRQMIPPRARVLNAPIHNSVSALTGRQMVMGYPGHLWTHGIEFQQCEQDVREMLRGGEAAESLLKNYQVQYVIIGPVERSQFEAREDFFATKYKTVVDVAGYRVYQVR